MNARFDGHDPSAGHDTAGVPWEGRTLSGTGFDADDGGIDPGLATALNEPERESALVRAVATARLIVPIVAVPGDGADGSTDMASVTATAPDGTQALLAFSSTDALRQWDSTARPVPVTAQRAALAAVQEQCQVIVLDVGSPDTVTLRSSMVWALAMDRTWQPPHLDETVRAAIDAACRMQEAVSAWTLEPGAQGEVVVALAVRPGLDAPQVWRVVQTVAEQIATDGEARARIDALRFRLVRA